MHHIGVTPKRSTADTFLFRCEWVEVEHGVERFDGYTFSINKKDLEAEIARKKSLGDASTKYVPRNTSVVKTSMELYKKVQASSSKVLNTSN